MKKKIGYCLSCKNSFDCFHEHEFHYILPFDMSEKEYGKKIIKFYNEIPNYIPGKTIKNKLKNLIREAKQRKDKELSALKNIVIAVEKNYDEYINSLTQFQKKVEEVEKKIIEIQNYLLNSNKNFCFLQNESGNFIDDIKKKIKEIRTNNIPNYQFSSFKDKENKVSINYELDNFDSYYTESKKMHSSFGKKYFHINCLEWSLDLKYYEYNNTEGFLISLNIEDKNEFLQGTNYRIRIIFSDSGTVETKFDISTKSKSKYFVLNDAKKNNIIANNKIKFSIIFIPETIIVFLEEARRKMPENQLFETVGVQTENDDVFPSLIGEEYII